MSKPKDLIELSYLSEAVSDMSFLGLMRLLEAARVFNQKMALLEFCITTISNLDKSLKVSALMS